MTILLMIAGYITLSDLQLHSLIHNVTISDWMQIVFYTKQKNSVF